MSFYGAKALMKRQLVTKTWWMDVMAKMHHMMLLLLQPKCGLVDKKGGLARTSIVLNKIVLINVTIILCLLPINVSQIHWKGPERFGLL